VAYRAEECGSPALVRPSGQHMHMQLTGVAYVCQVDPVLLLCIIPQAQIVVSLQQQFIHQRQQIAAASLYTVGCCVCAWLGELTLHKSGSIMQAAVRASQA